MSDLLDRACQAEADFLDHALAAFRQPENNTPSASHCWDCGEPIPETRRLAVRGCTRCVSCQEAFEQKAFYG